MRGAGTVHGADGEGSGAAPIDLAGVDHHEEGIVIEALPSRRTTRVYTQRRLDELLRKQAAALVVVGPELDVVDHELDGTAVCRELREAGLRAPIVYLAPAAGADLEQAVLEAGADELFVRPVPRERFVLRVRTLLRRSTPSGIETVLRSGELEVDFRARSATLAGRPLTLTTVQLDLLLYLLCNDDRVIPPDELVRKVLPQSDGATSNIRYHILQLRRALGEYRTCIVNFRGCGYRWVHPG